MCRQEEERQEDRERREDEEELEVIVANSFQSATDLLAHQDLKHRSVEIWAEEKGGGEIRFDGELVRKDGVFVVEDLAGLNW